MASSAEVIAAFKGVLRRSPAAGDFAHYASWPNAQLVTDLINSVESRTYVAPVIRLYDAVLGRRPDAAGLDFWVDFYRNSPSSSVLVSAAGGFLGSTEGQLRYPPAESNLQFVQRVYTQVLRRSGTVGDYNYWASVLTGGWSRAQLLAHFVSEAEYVNLAESGVSYFQQSAAAGASDAYTGPLF